MELMNLPLHFNSLQRKYVSLLVLLNTAMNKTLTNLALIKAKLSTQYIKETNLSSFNITSVELKECWQEVALCKPDLKYQISPGWQPVFGAF